MKTSEPILHVGRRFRVSDRAAALELLASHNLGTLISTGADGWPRASTSPLVIDRRGKEGPRLYARIASANPQSEHLRERQPLLYVVHGPRAYASPGWFPRRPAAPVLLHVTVQVCARPRLLDEDETAWLLLETLSTFEARQRRASRYDGGERFLRNSARAVAGFELVVDGIEAACKLSQDRTSEERKLIAAELEEHADSDDRAIAAMLRNLDPRRRVM